MTLHTRSNNNYAIHWCETSINDNTAVIHSDYTVAKVLRGGGWGGGAYAYSPVTNTLVNFTSIRHLFP